jgi:hypothetical protein
MIAIKRELTKFKNLFLACALVVLALTLAGCPGKQAEQEKTSAPAVETPASGMPAETEGGTQPGGEATAPAEGEKEALPEAPEAGEAK